MSYSTNIKSYLSELKIKKSCCKRNYGIGTAFASSEASAEPAFKCEACLGSFLRGLFVSCGHITDPSKQYHLDFTFDSKNAAERALAYISEIASNASIYQRKGKFIVYLKSSDSISEFLAAIGANSAAFDVMNNRIMAQMTVDVFRAVNFDTANIKRLTNAYERDIEAIKYLAENDELDKLPPHLKETAMLRLKYDHMSLADIGSLHSVAISKSGVKHRLDAITRIYNEKTANTDNNS